MGLILGKENRKYRSKPKYFAERETIPKLEPQKYYKLSSAQKRLWFLNKFEPDNPFYNMPWTFRLKGHFKETLFKKALEKIVGRHETLRTVFREIGDEPVQIIRAKPEFEYQFVDFSKFSNAEAQAKELLMLEISRAFDLSQDPMLRCQVIKIQENTYYVLLNIHHIASDGWSSNKLALELREYYTALSESRSPKTPELPIQYKDFSHWQNNFFKSESFKKQEGYWLKQLGGDLPVLELPIDKARSQIQTYQGATLEYPLDKKLVKKLKALRQAQGTTLFVTLLSVYKILLWKITGQEDLIVGTAIAGRKHEDTKNLIGIFINTLAIRSRIESENSFVEFLQQTKHITSEAIKNSDYPFEDLVKKINPERDSSHHPVFSTYFALDRLDYKAHKNMGELKAVSFDLDFGTSKFDLSLSINEIADNYSLQFEYNTDLFDRSTIERFLTYYQRILEEIVKQPEQSLKDIEILSEQEKHQLLVEFNDTQADYPKDKCIHELFEEQVEKTPNNIAIVFKDQKLTYQELNEKANQLAHYLRKHGVKAESLVGLMIERSMEMAIGILGILKAGGAYVPIDPTYPQERIHYIIESSQCVWVLSQEKLAKKLKKQDCKALLFEKIQADLLLEASENLSLLTQSNSLAYVIYTSGSTGKPKGVMVEHCSTVNYLTWFSKHFLETNSVIPLLNNIVFDASVGQLFAPLICGATVLIPKDLNNISKVLQLVQSQANIIDIVPSFLSALLRIIESNKEDHHLLEKNIKTLIVGGERLDPVLFDKLQNLFPKAGLFNLYGPTEATVTSHYSKLNLVNKITIGKPIANTKFYILDATGKLAPIGVKGEIYIAGVGLARGYFNQPALTEEKFKAHPFIEGEKIYRTGDLAKLLPDGNIEYLGRLDHQVKVRGFRIELGEIENVLLKKAELRECVVVTLGEGESKQLVAYYTGKKEKVEDLRDCLSKELPDYMSPHYFIHLDRLPLTPNGKVDRKALPEPSGERLISKEYVAPRNEIEKKLAKIWKEVLGLKQVGVYDNFFELGGHSLKAVQVHSRIKKELKVNISLKNLFEYSKIERLAQKIKEEGEIKGFIEHKKISKLPPQEYYELSSAQKRLWFLDKFEPNNPFYNIPWNFSLEGKLDHKIFKQALKQLILRHESLHTVFKEVDGRPVQQILSYSEDQKGQRVNHPLFDYQYTDLSSVKNKVEIAQKIASTEAHHPFNLSKGPLFRCHIIKWGQDIYNIHLVMHHIVSDGWSLGILGKELLQIYQSLKQGKELQVEPLPIQYKDYAHWQNQLFKTKEFKQQENYWLKTLAGELPVLDLPLDKPRPPVQTYNGSSVGLTLSKALSQGLKALSQKQGSTLFMTLLAAYKVWLSKLTGQEDLIVGVPVAGRNHPDIENLIGFFVNTLALRSTVQANQSFQELLSQVKQGMLGALENQDYPFEQLIEKVNPERDPSRSPIFSTMFNMMEGDTGLEKETNHVLGEPLDSDKYKIAKFDLTLSVGHSSKGLQIHLEYNTDLFEQANIKRFLKYYAKILAEVTRDATQALKDIEILSEQEKHQLLVGFNDTQADYPKDKCIHELFEEQVEKTPHNIAVVFQDQKLTYQELNEKANQLAHYIRAYVTKPESPIAIMTTRSIEMIIGMLGILKAGAAYVPLDPEYPEYRNQQILYNSKCILVLTYGIPKNKFSFFNKNTFHLEEDLSKLTTHSKQNIKFLTEAESTAYIMYTSGSTGKPKGILIPHRGVIRLVKNTNYIDIQQQDRILQISTYNFDAATFEVWGALLNGAQLHLISKSDVLDLKKLSSTILESQISIIFLTTAFFNSIVDHEPEAISQLRKLFFGGENVSVPHVKKALKKTKPNTLVHVYGPTENTTFSTYYPILNAAENSKTIPIGYPLANSKAYILDSNVQPVPIGITGEIYVSGDGLAKGYLKDNKKTQASFIYHPYLTETKLYRTGDMGRYLFDGSIEFIGRSDHQVKVRGYRIELGEIEAALRRHRNINKCIVIVRDLGQSNKELIAYYTSKTKESIEDLRENLKQILPNYMLPTYLVHLKELPLTPNGKVDRKALPEPSGERLISKEYVAPRDKVERKLAKVWEEVLGLKQVGVYDNFFDLGGDSIQSLRIVALASKEGLDFRVKQLFQHQSIAQLASVLEQTDLSEIKETKVSGPLPLTPIQHWFFEEEFALVHAFNQGMLLKVEPEVSPSLLKQAFAQLLIHHDGLRTHYKESEGHWHATIASQSEAFELKLVDLSSEALKTQEALINKALQELHLSLNINQGPLLAAALIERGHGQSDLLAIAIHHLVVDGVSWWILLEDLCTAYEQLREDKEVRLPRKSTSFQAWSEKLKDYIKVEKNVALESKEWLSGVRHKVTALPRDHVGNREPSYQEVITKLTKSQTDTLLQRVSEKMKLHINDILLAGLAKVVTEWSGKQTCLIDLEGHGREEDLFPGVDLSRTVGWFTTLFPACFNLEETDTLSLLTSTKEQLRAIPNKGVGYGILRYLSTDLELVEQLKSLAKAEIAFNYLGQFSQVGLNKPLLGLANPDQVLINPIANQSKHPGYLWNLNGWVTEGKLQINWAYRSDVHNKETMQKLAKAYENALAEILEACLASEDKLYSITDFDQASLSVSGLKRLLEKPKVKTNLEDIYDCSPLQEGILFHSLSSPQDDPYFIRTGFTLEGDLDTEKFKQAWKHLLQRHSILRSSFHWDGELSKPQQVVHEQVALPFSGHDWSSLKAEQQEAKLRNLLKKEHGKGFVLDHAPLIRIHLIKLKARTYKLVLCIHHLLIDGWSTSILFKDLWEFYELSEAQARLKAKDVKMYKNFIRWIRAQDLSQTESFWRKQLKGLTHATSISGDQAIVHQAIQEKEEHFKVSPELSQTLEEFAKKHRLTLNNLVQSAWALLLNRYTGEDKVIFGTTMSIRPAHLSDMENTVGLFINTLPTVVAIDPEQSVLKLLQQVQAQQVESQSYNYTSLTQVHAWSDISGDKNLFDSLYVFENYPMDSSAAQPVKGIKISEGIGIEQTGYPLSLTAFMEGVLQFRLLYDEGKYSVRFIQQILGHLKNLLEQISQHSLSSVSKLEILSEQEKYQLLVEFNDTQADYPKDKCIHELFEEQVKKTPHNIAVVFQDQKLTYQELNEKANQLAHYLRENGIQTGSPIGLMTDRSVEMIVSMIGILKAGAHYVPIDPESPPNRILNILEDSQAKWIIQHTYQDKKLNGFIGRFITWKVHRNEIEYCSTKKLSKKTSNSILAYIIYTSGSTGKPKGVMVSHQSVANLLQWMTNTYNVNKYSNVVQSTSMCFDVSVWEFFGPLMKGATQFIIEREVIQDINKLLLRLDIIKATHMSCVPSLYNTMLQIVENDNNRPRLKNMQWFLLAGEALKTQLIHKGQSLYPNIKIANIYGPTEATVYASYYNFPKNFNKRIVPIGRPIQNAQLLILNENQKIQPFGVKGELYIGGDGVSQGYLNQPTLTEERFVPHPFIEGEKLYRTGDLAKLLPDGNIEYLGRLDHQVKVRGFRIELGEIENVLLKKAELRECVVVTLGEGESKQLVAYYTGKKVSIEDLRSYLSKELPDYMIPHYFIHLDKLPLTPNGKINRKALPEPSGERLISKKYVAPRNEVESKLVYIWKEVLGVKKVGIHDDFFELGGHSLIAVRTTSYTSEVFQKELSLKAIFDYPTIFQYSKYLSQSKQPSIPLISEIEENKKTDINTVLEQLASISEQELNAQLHKLLNS